MPGSDDAEFASWNRSFWHAATLSTWLCCLVAVFSGCAKQKHSPEPSVSDAPGQKVRCTRAREESVIDSVEFVGRTQAFQRVQARARVSGFLQEIHFEPSQLVKKGDLLFTIEQDQYRALYEQSLAQIRVWEAKIKLAESNVARSEKLVKERATSEQEYQTDVASLAEAQAAKAQAVAAAALTRLNVEYTLIHSPIDGRVDRTQIDVGNYVTGGTIGGTVLTTIVNTDPMYAYGSVDEGVQLEYIRRHMALLGNADAQQIANLKIPVYLKLQDEDDFSHQGILDFVQNEINQSTGTSMMRGRFDNSGGLLKPGMFVRMRIPLTEKYSAVVVPDRAVGTDQATKFVFVVGDDGVVQQRQVELGARQEDGNRVIKSGLKRGERVVVAGLTLIRAGMKVVVEEDGAAGASDSGGTPSDREAAPGTSEAGESTGDSPSPSAGDPSPKSS